MNISTYLQHAEIQKGISNIGARSQSHPPGHMQELCRVKHVVCTTECQLTRLLTAQVAEWVVKSIVSPIASNQVCEVEQGRVVDMQRFRPPSS